MWHDDYPGGGGSSVGRGCWRLGGRRRTHAVHRATPCGCTCWGLGRRVRVGKVARRGMFARRRTVYVYTQPLSAVGHRVQFWPKAKGVSGLTGGGQGVSSKFDSSKIRTPKIPGKLAKSRKRAIIYACRLFLMQVCPFIVKRQPSNKTILILFYNYWN